ncbi:YczI family protein [Rossellomorea sp. AcN35-11]|nr:YczI family protein [Rossellomorea aquimaris]NMH68555.1 DUF3953 domain-containing protein [Bacillus sp. RO3]WJV31224.1 YczI family protein [Rossellomorea sp. AcN35-11]
MILRLRILFSAIAITLAIYGLLAEHPPRFLYTVMLLSLGGMMLMMGTAELQKNRIPSAILSFVSGAFIWVVGIFITF